MVQIFIPPISAPKVIEVSSVQAIAALKNFNKLAAVQSIIDALPADNLTRVAWERSPTVRRDSPTTIALASALGLSETDLDNLFEYAASVKF